MDPALIALQKQLLADDAFLDDATRGGQALSPSEIQAALLRMEQTIGSMQTQSSKLPADARIRVSSQCEDYRKRLANHRRICETKMEASSRGQLFKGACAGGPANAASKSQAENDQAETNALIKTRNRMKEEMERMESVASTLSSSSKTLNATKNEYNNYASTLDSASKVLGALKSKTEEDAKYIWWSFLFFLSVVAYIVLRRLKVFKMIFMGASWTWWSGQQVGSVLQDSMLMLTNYYEQASTILGIK
eukprot:TRINITY_DN49315_c0_g1_i1.p1 TRINITY_DN49315_c0_g1~~TRINITY_DN49315_c0_g1_i1.p1  ORF type:complete len:249 (-),score=40.73 TRINITY_DN49315_c0_g1_i1:203-949(-)